MIAYLLAATLVVHSPPQHKLQGLTSHYAKCLEGTLTSTGEVFRHSKMTAAHRTLPLGTLVEVKSRATGKKIKVLINDRGPFHKRFVIDLTITAYKALGIKNLTRDRYVTIRVLKLPAKRRSVKPPKMVTKADRKRYTSGSCATR